MLTAGEASQKFDVRLVGDANFVIQGVSDPKLAKPSHACFVAREKYLDAMAKSPAGCWIISPALFELVSSDVKASKTFLLSDNSYLTFIKLMNHFLSPLKSTGKKHPQADIDRTAEVHQSAQVDAFVSVGARTKIGEGVILHSGVWIAEDVTIGESSVIYGGARIYAGSHIGKRNHIHSGAVIGADGFGFVRDKDGTVVKVPQLGRAILHDDVEVGANTTIDRGTMGDTIIGAGSKIDNLVMIGHNCVLGKNAILCSMVGLSGHTVLGDNVLMAGQAGSKGHLKIGDNVQVGAQSGVTKDIPAGVEVKGYPARPVKEYFRNQVLIHKMTEIYSRLVRLENK